MQGSKIYTDFSEDIEWIRREVASGLQSLPSALVPLAEYYTKGRLKVLKESWAFRVTDRRMGRPIPYLAFWVADALGQADRHLRKLSGLSLVYSSIATTVRDDVLDSPGDTSGKLRLDRFWSREYLDALREVFPDQRGFKQVIQKADVEWKRYKEWQSNPSTSENHRPFSSDFLGESSRYYISCALPSLSAVAYSVGRKDAVPQISRYLREFSMGWKIFDDLMDWERDLGVREMNRSSVLIYFRNRMRRKKAVDRTEALSWFLSDEFVRDAYGAMIGFYLRAQKAVASFGHSYLDEFLGEQISLQTEKRASLLESASLMQSKLNESFKSILSSQ